MSEPFSGTAAVATASASTGLRLVEEVASGDWGIGGRPLSTADVKALAAGVHAG